MKCAVVVPVFNRRKITLHCLDSLASLDTRKFYIIVVDSGSTDGTREAIRERFSDVILVEATSESWWAAATNLGIKEAEKLGCDYVITCNDDNYIPPQSLQQLLDTAAKNPRAIIAATVCYYNERDKVLFAGRKRSRLTDRFFYLDNSRKYSELEKGIREVDLLQGMCTLFPMQVFMEAGYFDEQTFPHLFADDDLALRAKKCGYSLLVDTESVIYNDHTKTGINPYHARAGFQDCARLLGSRKSVFQVSTRTRFLWRHRRSVFSFFLTWIVDYCRLFCVVIARWVLPDKYFNKLANIYLGFLSR